MALRCRVGDLAVVLSGRNSGALVTVVRWHCAGGTPTEIGLRVKYAGWVVDSGALLLAGVGDRTGRIVHVRFGVLTDDNLQPIRPERDPEAESTDTPVRVDALTEAV